MTELLLGIDVGTTSTKTCLYDETGREVSHSARPTPLRWHGPDQCDQNPDDFYRATLATIRDCVCASGTNSKDVAAIGIAGQMAGVLGIGGDWRPSTPYDSWLDLRCTPDVEHLDEAIGSSLAEITGCPPMVDHAPKMRWWRREQPAAFSQTQKFIMPGSYVAGKLAGLPSSEAFIDHTYLHFTGVADARSATWSADLMDAVGIPEEKMPRIVSPSTVIGLLTREAGAECGLPAGVPIAAGLGDTAAGALGAGIVRPGQLLDSAGSAAVMAGASEDFCPDPVHKTLIVMRSPVDGQWISLAYLSGGSLLGWFQGVLTSQTSDPDEVQEVDLGAMTQDLSRVPPGAGGLLFMPFIDGRILPSNSSMRGAWVGLNRRHGRAHMIRAILESVPYEYSSYLQIFRDLHPNLRLVDARVIGGGAKSAMWNRIKASVLGVPYARLARDELGCWGAALVAGHAVALFPDLVDAATTSTPSCDWYQPDPKEHEDYAVMIDVYRDTLSAIEESFRCLAQVQAEDWSPA
jgi:xylulokinase